MAVNHAVFETGTCLIKRCRSTVAQLAGERLLCSVAPASHCSPGVFASYWLITRQHAH